MAANTLLEGPAPPTCISKPIDFTQAGLPEYAESFAISIENLVTPEECKALLAFAESSAEGKWEQAMVNVGGGRQKMVLDTRNCGRIILDDVKIASRIQARIMPHLPKEIVTLTGKPRITGNGPVKRHETWRLTRLNERLRFLKYTSGMYFREHCDGSYVTPDESEVSYLTVHLYLNGNPMLSKDEALAKWQREGREEARSRHAMAAAAGEPVTMSGGLLSEDDQELVGGATRFFSWQDDKHFDFAPSMGSCIVFQHRNLIHSGEDVIQGCKYTLRTDVMYHKLDTNQNNE